MRWHALSGRSRESGIASEQNSSIDTCRVGSSAARWLFAVSLLVSLVRSSADVNSETCNYRDYSPVGRYTLRSGKKRTTETSYCRHYGPYGINHGIREKRNRRRRGERPSRRLPHCSGSSPRSRATERNDARRTGGRRRKESDGPPRKAPPENGFFDKFDSRVTARGTRREPGKVEGVPLSQSLNQLNGWQNHQRGGWLGLERYGTERGLGEPV